MRRARKVPVAAVVMATACRVLVAQQELHALEESTVTPAPPPLRSWRYDEDYSYLQDSRLRSGQLWDATKWLALDSQQDLHLSLGGELRVRWEGYANDLWGAAAVPDHDAWWLRALPYADLHVGQRLRGFAQFITAWELGDEAGASPIDVDRADVLQAFVDFRFPLAGAEATLRVGRQVLALGSERLVGARYGPNVLRSFDLVRGLWGGDGVHVEVFWGRPVDVAAGAFDDRASSTESIWSAYTTVDLDFGDRSGIDVYYLGHVDERAQFEQGAGDELRHTLGARFFGARGPWDWNFEGFEQFGSFGAGDIRAWSLASDTGFGLAEVPTSPRLGLRANIISGDDDPLDPDLGTFNALYPKGKYFGEIGLIGPYNLVDVHPNLSLVLTEQVTAELGAVWYWRERTADGVYDNGGGLVRASGGSDERRIGTQFDATLTFALDRSLDATLSWSTFLPGPFLRDTGPAERVHFVAAEVRLVF